jgi:hypothetical protein
MVQMHQHFRHGVGLQNVDVFEHLTWLSAEEHFIAEQMLI